MKAVNNELYAVIENNEVVQIFNNVVMPEWDENTLNVMKIPMNKEDYVIYGTKVENGEFVYETMESLRLRAKSNISASADVDTNAILEDFMANSEFDTWDLQIQEAKDYLEHKDESRLVFLPEIAKIREMDLESLCAKVVEKNTEFNQKRAKIIGQAQKLYKELELATTPKELNLVRYSFLYHKEEESKKQTPESLLREFEILGLKPDQIPQAIAELENEDLRVRTKALYESKKSQTGGN